MTDPARSTRILTAAFLLVLAGVGVADHDLWRPHEHRVAAVIDEMRRSGDLVVPTLNGVPFLEKPPLYAVTALAALRTLGGERARAYRVASALFGLLALAASVRMAFLLAGPREALAAGASLATMLGFLRVGHWILVDSALVACVALAWWAAVEVRAGRRWLWPAFWIFTGAAFLAKGLIGPAFVLPPLALVLAWERDRERLRELAPLRGLVLLAAVAALWLVPLASRDGGALFREWLWDENLSRFAPGAGLHGHHDEDVSFYLPGLFVILLPWSPWWLFGLWQRLNERARSASTLERMAGAWVAFGTLMLSLSRTKRELYAFPLLPGFALLLGAWLGARERLPLRDAWIRSWQTVAGLAFLGSAGACAAGRLAYATPFASWSAAAIVLGAGGLALERLRRRPQAGDPAFWLAPALVAAVGLLLWVPPADRLKSHVRGMSELAALLPPGPVHAHNVGETLTGSISFYTGRHYSDLPWRSDIQKWIDAGGAGVLLVEEDSWPFTEPPEAFAGAILGRVHLTAAYSDLIVVRPPAWAVVRPSPWGPHPIQRDDADGR